MRTADFDYDLPDELIAQEPTPEREGSRLLVLDRKTRAFAHRKFSDLLDLLGPGDLVVLNDSRVIPARLRAVNAETGGRFEILLLEEVETNQWWAMFRPGKRARVGTRVVLLDTQGAPTAIRGNVLASGEEGHRRVQFDCGGSLTDALDQCGEIPLPPYIRRNAQRKEDRERYQTVYALRNGSVAAPTAGLHFSGAILERMKARGIETAFVTLHVGLGTFAPVKKERPEEHEMHAERYELSESTARRIRDTKARGKRVVAVGTTTLRVLESVAANGAGEVHPCKGSTRLFIYPPASFRVVDALLTNFHLPRSTLLMLVSAFAEPGATGGVALVRQAYAEAIRQRYRFFSYGDAMLLR